MLLNCDQEDAITAITNKSAGTNTGIRWVE